VHIFFEFWQFFDRLGLTAKAKIGLIPQYILWEKSAIVLAIIVDTNLLYNCQNKKKRYTRAEA